MIFILLRSIVLLLVWSTLAGVSGVLLTGTYIGGGGLFILATLCQFWGHGIARENRLRAEFNELDEAMINRLKDAENFKIPVNISCAACRMISPVPVSITENVTFTCPSCNQLNKVFVQFSTVRATTPLVTTELAGEVVMDDVDELPSKG